MWPFSKKEEHVYKDECILHDVIEIPATAEDIDRLEKKIDALIELVKEDKGAEDIC